MHSILKIRSQFIHLMGWHVTIIGEEKNAHQIESVMLHALSFCCVHLLDFDPC